MGLIDAARQRDGGRQISERYLEGVFQLTGRGDGPGLGVEKSQSSEIKFNFRILAFKSVGLPGSQTRVHEGALLFQLFLKAAQVGELTGGGGLRGRRAVDFSDRAGLHDDELRRGCPTPRLGLGQRPFVAIEQRKLEG